MNKKILFEWSQSNIIITILFAIALLVAGGYLLKNVSFHTPIPIWLPKIFFGLFFIGIDVYVLSNAPRYMTYDEKESSYKNG